MSARHSAKAQMQSVAFPYLQQIVKLGLKMQQNPKSHGIGDISVGETVCRKKANH